MAIARMIWADERNGGAAGAMDSYPYASLTDKSACLVVEDSTSSFVVYRWDSASTDAEDGDLVIRADDDGGGSGRWHKVTSEEFKVTDLYGTTGNLLIQGGSSSIRLYDPSTSKYTTYYQLGDNNFIYNGNAAGVFEVQLTKTGSILVDALNIDPDAGMKLFEKGVAIDEFSNDGTMAGDSDTAVPTEKAVVTFVQDILPLGGHTVTRNPNFNLWNDGTAFAGVTNSTTANGWNIAEITDGSIDVNRVLISDLTGHYGYGLQVDVQTADTSIGATQYSTLLQIIEGFDATTLYNRKCWMSFWVKSPKAGIHCITLRDLTYSASFIAEYTIDSANTWQYVSIEIDFDIASSPGSLGTWGYTFGRGFIYGFTLACGSTFGSGSTGWNSGNYLSTSNQVNCLDSASNNFYVAGVHLHAGQYPLNDIPMEPIGLTESREDRYFQKYILKYGSVAFLCTSTNVGDGSTTLGYGGINFRTQFPESSNLVGAEDASDPVDFYHPSFGWDSSGTVGFNSYSRDGVIVTMAPGSVSPSSWTAEHVYLTRGTLLFRNSNFHT